MATLLEELLQPISDSSFCGEDGSYEPEFEAAKAEAEKITGNDYKAMAEQARKFLTRKSKDMRVLGYLAMGTGISGSLTDFGMAVQAYCRLAMERWEDIHPRRPSARSNALKWLNQERSLGLLQAAGGGGGDFEALNGACEELAKLQSFCDGKFPEGPPAFGGFIKLVKELAAKNKPREEKAEAPAGSASSAPAAAAAAAPAAPAEIGSQDDAFLAIQKASYYLHAQGRSNPLPYRLNRILRWTPVAGDVPSENRRTLIPPPYPHVLEGYRNMASGQKWSDILAMAEETFSTDAGLLWLDLQRYLCLALQAQGGEHAACAKAVRIELALLLQRAPGLPELSYNDGTPLADALTREWIQAEVIPSLGGSGGGAGTAAIKKKGDVGEEQKAAEALLSEGKLDQALHALRTGLSNDSSQKNNFDRKFIMAELCYKGGKPNIARAILEELIAVMDRLNLVEWDPEPCVQVYHLAQKTYLALCDQAEEHARPPLREKALAMHTQISKLNPVLAISADFK